MILIKTTRVKHFWRKIGDAPVANVQDTLTYISSSSLKDLRRENYECSIFQPEEMKSEFLTRPLQG